ncbi:unnamed protein product [Paramecium pentaurelia]|uniref:SAM domain-containing protein n=1 Tax=Paramecium pentaurelia TaxID=43138 RepID=A0A8S1VA96_9CILI|nr:unnamed protein product [Paramecium pentaurelia]
MKKKSQSKGNTQKLQVEVDIIEQRIVGFNKYCNLKKNLLNKKKLLSLRIHKMVSSINQYSSEELWKTCIRKTQGIYKKIPTEKQIKQGVIQTIILFKFTFQIDQTIRNLIIIESELFYIEQNILIKFVKFLNSINLDKHAVVILENGFDEMDLLKEISVDHLKDMNIPPIDARKLLNRVQKLMETEERKLIQFQKQAQHLKESQSHKEEIVNSEIYNEEEQHRLFQEAVLEYRQQQKEQPIQYTEEILVEDESLGYISSRQNKKEEQQRNKMKFLLSGANQWKMFDIDYDQKQGTDQQPVIIDKTSCYQCYRLFDQKYAIFNNSRQFCTQECLESFKLQNIYLSRSQSCAKQIDISQAFYEIGQWFCNQDFFKQYQWESVNIRGRTHISL